MNRKNIAIAMIAAAFSLGTASSFAAGIDNGNNYPEIAVQGHAKSRAEVRAELTQARAEGLIPQGDADYPVYVASGPGVSRADVRSELAQARADGQLAATDVDYPVLTAQGSTKTRAEVRAELAQARAAGNFDMSQGS